MLMSANWHFVERPMREVASELRWIRSVASSNTHSSVSDVQPDKLTLTSETQFFLIALTARNVISEYA
jgi:hypothetical protein